MANKAPIFLRSDTTMIWVIVAFASFWFAIACLIPGQTMVIATYKKALMIMPQFYWGLAFFLHALISAVYLFACNIRVVSIFASLLGVGLWALIVASMMRTVHSWMPIGGEVAIVFACLFLCIRTLIDE